MENKNNGRVTLFTFVIICALTFILFFQYIIGIKSFYFMHVVSDGVMQFYPKYVELSKAMKQSLFGSFSWTSGWGAYVMDTNPFSQLIIAFGENHIIYMTGLVTALKVTLTGLCFSLYLKELKVEKITNIIYSMMYAFSIQVIGGGCLRSQTEIAIILPVFLYAVEKFRNSKKINAFFAGLVLAVLCLQLYYLLVLTAFVLTYSFVTHILQNEKKAKIKKKYLLFAGVVCICLLIFCISPIKKIFMTYRFKKGLKFLNESAGKTFSYKNIKIIMTTILRSFSPNILGILGANKYYGGEYGWYFADGSFYCGILNMLIIPQAFRKNERKRNLVFGLGIALCALVTILPPLRLVLSGFGIDEFRLIRIWFLFILVFISFTAFNDIFSGKYKLDKKRLYITSGIYIVFLTAGFFMHIYLGYYLLSVALIVVYNVLLINICEKENRFKSLIVIIVVCAEVILTNYGYINNKDVIYKNEWEEAGSLYNDEIVDSVKWLKSYDTTLYRIDKSFFSVMLNDASVQDYNGTMYYVGGIGIQEAMDYNVTMGIPTMFNNRNYCMGSCGDLYSDSLLSVKYVISHSDNFYEYGYEFLNNENGLNIYYNSNYIPFAFFYDDYMLKEDFSDLPLIDRKRNILNFAVVDDAPEKLTKVNKNEIIKFNDDLCLKASVDDYVCGDVVPIEPLGEGEVLVIETVSGEEYNLGLKWAVNGEWKDDNSQYMSIYEENGSAVAEVTNQPGTNYVVLYSYGTDGGEVIQKLNIYVLDAKEYYSGFDKRMEEIKKDNVDMLTHSADKTTFNVDTDRERMLFMSIPYDSGFDIYIDGKKAEKYKVNYAFTGVLVPKGSHVVEAVYKRIVPKQYKEAAVIIVIYILLSLFLITKKKINERRSKEND